MRSDKQIAASRNNGVKSRGPVTPEGKLSSARANLRHGMLARTVLLDGESRERFNALMNSLEEDLQPESAIERLLVHKMVVAHWRQMRIWGLEKAGISHEAARQQGDAITRDAIAFRTSDTHMSEYEMRCDRQFSRALDRFERFRANKFLRGRSQQTLETKAPDANQ